MDSLSQAALGAAVGAAYLGPRVGRRALVLGAAVATIPDLDVLAIPLLDPVTQLTAHRTYTHNLPFLALASLLCGGLLWRLQRRSGVGPGQWTLFAALCLFSAVGLDLFTSYGVPLFYPFSDASLAIASVSVIDPLYTLPLLIALVWAWRRREDLRRPLLWGLAVSSGYLALTVGIKLHAQSIFQAELARQGISHARLFTKPTFFNSLLWRAVAEAEGGYWVGFYSLLDADRRVGFQHLPRNGVLLEDIETHPAVRGLRTATDGFLQALPEGPDLLLRDVRYGSGTDWLPPEQDRPFVFTYRLRAEHGRWQIEPVDTRRGAGREGESLRQLWWRVLGQE